MILNINSRNFRSDYKKELSAWEIDLRKEMDVLIAKYLEKYAKLPKNEAINWEINIGWNTSKRK